MAGLFTIPTTTSKGRRFIRTIGGPAAQGLSRKSRPISDTYFRDAKNLYVNLYIPSVVRWNHNGSEVSLTQKGPYPYDGSIEFEFSGSKHTELILNLRIPAWADGAMISVNGKRWKNPVAPGTFASLRRKWKNGDRVELELPMRMRLESLDSANPDIVALLRGPLVLFAITQSPEGITRDQLLSAKSVGDNRWQVPAAAGPMTMLSFAAIEGEQYSTYLKVAG
jgi:uncharacterized protein